MSHGHMWQEATILGSTDSHKLYPCRKFYWIVVPSVQLHLWWETIPLLPRERISQRERLTDVVRSRLGSLWLFLGTHRESLNS